MNFQKPRTLLWAAAFSLFAATAQAAPITGDLGIIGGGYTLTADGVDFSGGRGFVFGANGHYREVPNFTPVTFHSFIYNPFPPIPQTLLWSFTSKGRTYSFNLTSVTVTHRTDTEIVITGVGKLKVTGLDETDGQWNFTGNTQGSVFTFSSGTKAAPNAAAKINTASGVGVIALLIGGLLFTAEISRRSLQASP
jgi:hypothetical protein